ncbi:MAG: radical SAM protein [Deferribacterota bacterium]|nr:radical SAM protein [Deferribacterota bacterium]
MTNVYGPVPSRRLGKSLGINNIPYKICTYACIYCQIGKTIKMQNKREAFYKPEKLVSEVKNLLSNIHNKDKFPDYLTIVPDGEPTLDINIGILIEKLKVFNIPIAVITNASLIDQPDVRGDLSKADYISVKIDSVDKNKWRTINRPYKALNFYSILEGIKTFRCSFSGHLSTETMVIKGINDKDEDFIALAKYLNELKPDTAYLSIPIRPPAVKTVEPPEQKVLLQGFYTLSKIIPSAAQLTYYEGDSFFSAGNSESDLLSITAVHPMREDAVVQLLNRNNDSYQVVEKLIKQNMIEKIHYKNHYYYLRKFS